MNKVKDEYNLGVGSDDIISADNHILSTVSRENGIIGQMVRYFISGEGTFFKIFIKTL